VNLRDRVEVVLRAWDRHETNQGRQTLIDYDCNPVAELPAPLARLDVLTQLTALRRQSADSDSTSLTANIGAHEAFLRAILGERPPLDRYVGETQGCRALGWPSDYVERVGQLAQEQLAAMGIDWGEASERDLDQAEGPLDLDDLPDAIREAATEYEPLVRNATRSTASYGLTIETTSVDAYWSYWLDGAGSSTRLRLNVRNAHFTAVQARQFALHEVLGHALQSASFAHRCATEEVTWVRLLAVHAQHQVLLEGLAQTLPLFVARQDSQLIARVRLAHYLQLVLAELHVAINEGKPVEECAELARARVPFWTSERIADFVVDRTTNPALRTYLWAYPAGLDWFVALADRAEPAVVDDVLRAAYRDPLTPAELQNLWPAGPPIGGR